MTEGRFAWTPLHAFFFGAPGLIAAPPPLPRARPAQIILPKDDPQFWKALFEGGEEKSYYEVGGYKSLDGDLHLLSMAGTLIHSQATF